MPKESHSLALAAISNVPRFLPSSANARTVRGSDGAMRKCRYSIEDPIENPDLPDKHCPAQPIWRKSMSYAGDRLIYDADSHLMELPDFLSAHGDPSSRHLLPPLGTRTTGLFDPGEHVGKAGNLPKTSANCWSSEIASPAAPSGTMRWAHSAARSDRSLWTCWVSSVRSCSRYFVPG
jgi:hypothetical protein